MGNVHWSDIVDNDDLNQSFNNFHKKLLNIIDNEAPYCTYTPSRKINEPWLTAGILKCQKKQLLLYKDTLKTTANDEVHRKYKNYRNCLTKLRRNCKIMFYQNQCEQFK